MAWIGFVYTHASSRIRGMLADARAGKIRHHALVGLLRQSVFGGLAGYEDLNGAERLRHDRRCTGLLVGSGRGRGGIAEPAGRLRDAVACST
jgi:hypothetical protein